jgi:uncharacterized repeat protein (TIGR03837 family)
MLWRNAVSGFSFMHQALRSLTWDIFCNVIDNYGDIGVTWRLARQLRHDYGQTIRLWVDDLHSFARLCPALDPECSLQVCEGIEVRYWPENFPQGITPCDVVLDAFGCSLPESFLEAMAQRSTPPFWINLEYLSAEDWVECCHGMQSPHPSLALTRHFFFPGFSEKTGGVIAEQGILQAVDEWQINPVAQTAFWQQLGVPPRQPGELRVSMFAYENPGIGELLTHWAQGAQPVTCLVPEGRILTDITAGFFRRTLSAGDSLQQGALTLHILPFSDQPTYDRLLWSCDVNFVRGEDSFMRAQLAKRPFVWHIYPQQEAAHWVKLDAFWQRYTRTLPEKAVAATLGVNHAWNHGQDVRAAWREFQQEKSTLDQHARQWAQHLLEHGDLAARLLSFIRMQPAS